MLWNNGKNTLLVQKHIHPSKNIHNINWNTFIFFPAPSIIILYGETPRKRGREDLCFYMLKLSKCKLRGLGTKNNWLVLEQNVIFIFNFPFFLRNWAFFITYKICITILAPEIYNIWKSYKRNNRSRGFKWKCSWKITKYHEFTFFIYCIEFMWKNVC